MALESVNRIGNLIRFFRQVRELTQKQLAAMCELNESTIRNYELGNRHPDEKTLLKIANALEISYYTLADTSLFTSFGALHVLFNLERSYGLVPTYVDDEIHLVFRDPRKFGFDSNDEGQDALKLLVEYWAHKQSEKDDGEITDKDYVFWQAQFPQGVNPLLSSVEQVPYAIEYDMSEHKAPIDKDSPEEKLLRTIFEEDHE